MAEKKFEKKTLNREEHKKMDDVADGVKKGGGALLILGTIAVGIKKYGPRVVKTAVNLMKKS